MNDHDIADEISALLLDTMMQSEPPCIPDHLASFESFKALHTLLVSLREVLHAASNGDLSIQVPFKGFVGGTLKTLQANLKHLTWQTQRVASGDFTQRVEFMGEFSQSFNAMVIKLDETLTELMKKKTELSQTNEELLKEINAREKMELALLNSQEELRRQAITDSLTGIYNRNYFNKLAKHEIDKALRYSRSISVIMFDIDFFKRVNDTFGHATGDKVLRTVVADVKKMTRASDVFARYGGEEFIVLLPETPAKAGHFIADRIRMKIQEMVIPSGNSNISITASFGISDHLAMDKNKGMDRILSDFFSTADQAMYDSKRNGRNRVTVYTP